MSSSLRFLRDFCGLASAAFSSLPIGLQIKCTVANIDDSPLVPKDLGSDDTAKGTAKFTLVEIEIREPDE